MGGVRLGVRLGLGYIKDVRAEVIRELVAERERGGCFRGLGELAARCGAGRPTLEQLAWSGACDALVDTGGSAEVAGSADTHDEPRSQDVRRRLALWQLGVATPGRAAGGEGAQLALPQSFAAGRRR